jgi:hypothetical protein
VTPARCRKVKGRGDEPRTEAPVNGGRNYNGPKVTEIAALVKFGYMLEYPSISEYSPLSTGSNKLRSADNQQERPAPMPSEAGILRDHTPNSREHG